MPRRPATITQADIARLLRAGKQAGANELEVRVGQASCVFRIAPSTVPETAPEKADEIIL